MRGLDPDPAGCTFLTEHEPEIDQIRRVTRDYIDTMGTSNDLWERMVAVEDFMNVFTWLEVEGDELRIIEFFSKAWTERRVVRSLLLPSAAPPLSESLKMIPSSDSPPCCSVGVIKDTLMPC